MLRTVLKRHTFALVAIALASILLYPVAQAGMDILTWCLLGLAILAALLTLTTK